MSGDDLVAKPGTHDELLRINQVANGSRSSAADL
jgi:hypothetical protein